MKLYTRTGDSGETALFDGSRVRKDDPRVEAYGDVDELNAWLGLVRTAGLDEEFDADIVKIQRDLSSRSAPRWPTRPTRLLRASRRRRSKMRMSRGSSG